MASRMIEDRARHAPGPVDRLNATTAGTASAGPAAIGQLKLPANEAVPPARRLLVLVPDLEIEAAGLATTIRSLAAPRGLDVMFLGRADDTQTEPLVRRQLAHLAALTRDQDVPVHTALALEHDWVRAVQAHWQPGDLVVCHAGQRVPAGPLGIRRQALDQALMSAMQAPVYSLSGDATLQPGPRAEVRAAARLLRLAATLLVILGAFWLQVQITQIPGEQAKSALLILSVAAEFGLLALLNTSSRS